MNENREPIKIEDIRPHPFIVAFLEIYGAELDAQILELEKNGARIRHGVIFQRDSDTSDHTV